MMKTTETLKAIRSLSQDLKERFSLSSTPTEEDYARLVDMSAMAKTCAGHFSDDGKPGAGLIEQDDGRLAIAAGPGVVSSPEKGITLNIDEESPLYFDDDGGLAINPTQKLSVEFFEGLSQENKGHLFNWFNNADKMDPSVTPLPEFTQANSNTLGSEIAFSRDGLRLVVGGKPGSIFRTYLLERNPEGWSIIYHVAHDNLSTRRPLCINGNGDIFIIGFNNTSDMGGYRISREQEGEWQTLESMQKPANGAIGMFYANSVSMDSSGDYLVVGSPGHEDNKGSCFLIRGLDNRSEQRFTLPLPVANDSFGTEVCISADGRTFVASAPGRNDDNGEVTVWQRFGEKWVMHPPLSPDGVAGKFGASLSLNNAGDMLAVGCPEEEARRGAVYLYHRCNNKWEFRAKLTGDASEGEQFGLRVALSGDGGTLAVSSPVGKNKDGIVTGAAWWFGEDLKFRQRLLAEDGMVNHRFGQSIALGRGGNLLAIGAPGAADTGKVYIYE
ncbi:hypothetical protein [Escherichia sp. E1130]|uniref:hypothetical protein n=1 Tax=Escherichia sp. E1130 TaxID=2041645 RepID=UPI0014369996|nr:hypothetical protein [Escherichia sp. E1130]